MSTKQVAAGGRSQVSDHLDASLRFGEFRATDQRLGRNEPLLVRTEYCIGGQRLRAHAEILEMAR